MSEPRRILHLVVEGFPKKRLPELADASAEVFELTEANALAALEKIFAADTVAVWGSLESPQKP